MDKLNIKIENLIYEIRGKQVMLDCDLAKLYEVETKRINEAVKNNPLKFPDRYCFRISENDYNNLKSKNMTSSYGGSRKGHNVFTEQGVAMLSTILKSKTAIEVSIRIMDAFVEMKRYISNSLIEQRYINELVLKDNKRIDILEETFNSFKEKNNHIFFEGQIYDAYSLLLDIFNKAKKEIIIIDNYVNKDILDVISKINIRVLIISKNMDEQLIKKYKSQYCNLEILYKDIFHDRFIIIDKKILYTCGASFKDLGNKCFAINKIDDKEYLNLIIKKLN